jgi:hypothetical protein
MFKSKTKYAWEGWESSGKEDWVFSVKHPCELIGVHAKLIDAQIRESEKVECCIYSPRVSSTSTPFGFKSEESSWGLCATDDRFIISKNRHAKNLEPELFSISFDDVLYFNIGRVLLLSWFSITYAQEKKKRQIDILFASNGRHHFEKAMRSYKKYQNAVNTDELGLESFSAASFIHKIQNKLHADSLKTLISSGEKCLCVFSCRYSWEKFFERRSFFRKRKVFYYPRSNATFLLTNKALLLARDSLETGIDSGVNILTIPLGKIKAVSAMSEELNDSLIQRIKISLAQTEEDYFVAIPYICEDEGVLVNTMQSLMGKK